MKPERHCAKDDPDTKKERFEHLVFDHTAFHAVTTNRQSGVPLSRRNHPNTRCDADRGHDRGSTSAKQQNELL